MKCFSAAAAMLCLASPAYAQMDPASIAELLSDHNAYRTPSGLPPLEWSTPLANRAQNWADHLAATGTFTHSGPGQNLAIGTPGITLTQFVDLWGNERANFTDGIFPAISTTGNWVDAGHYSQLVWAATTQLGCGFTETAARAILVCDYAPPGNVEGERPY